MKTLLLIGLLLVMTTTACGLLWGGYSDCSDELRAMLRVELPPSAAEIDEQCSMGIVNPTYTARFSLAAADLETFQQNTHVSDWQADAPESGVFEDEAAQMGSLLYGSYSDGVLYEEVLIDTSDPQQFHIYYSNSFVD